MNKKIYIKDWLQFKPYETPKKADLYYLKLSNQVKDAITSNPSSEINLYLNDENLNRLACFLTCYFEDVISETNIWKSFMAEHKRLYTKPLPFYEVKHYDEDEINVEDIIFLIWYYLNTFQTNKFITPYKDFYKEMALQIIQIFDEEWEFAPENEYLKSFYQIDENETDFYEARNLIDIILFKSYLFYSDTALNLKETELDIITKNKEDEHILLYLRDNRDDKTHKSHTRILSLTGKEWAAKILGEKHGLSSSFLQISKKIKGYFLYKGQDHKDVFLEHIASGKKFKMTKKSYDYADDLDEIDKIVYIGIAKWKGEWWFSGIEFQIDFKADLVLDEKNSVVSRMAVNFLDHQSENVDEIIHKQLKAFREFNHGSQIAFLPSDEVKEFCQSFFNYFNKSLGLSDDEIEESEKRSRKEGFFGGDEQDKAFNDANSSTDSALVFFNHNSGMEIANDINSAFPMDNNPYFDETQSHEHILTLLMNEGFSTELAMFCIDNFKNKLPFFTEGAGKVFLKDIDFLLRFWKKENYHTEPELTFTGEKNE